MIETTPAVVMVSRPNPLKSPVDCVVEHATADEFGAQIEPPHEVPVLKSAPVATVRKCSCAAPVLEFVTFWYATIAPFGETTGNCPVIGSVTRLPPSSSAM